MHTPTSIILKPPTFNTPRLVLKELAEADAPSYAKHFVDYEIIRHLTHHVPWPYPPNGVLEYIRTSVVPEQGHDRWVWGIRLKENPEEVIGAVDLWRKGRPENRGFWLGRKFWGKGYMTEAVWPVMDFAFNTAGFRKLVFSNAVGNDRSARIKEKTGARRISQIASKYVDPALTESEVWELTKEEWLSRNTPAR